MQEGIISLMQMAKTVRSSKKIKWSWATFYLRINRSNNRRRYSKFCKFRRYYHSRAKSINWICRTKGNRTNSETKIARRFSKCRILIRTWFYWHDCRKKRLKKCIRKAFGISWEKASISNFIIPPKYITAFDLGVAGLLMHKKIYDFLCIR